MGFYRVYVYTVLSVNLLVVYRVSVQFTLAGKMTSFRQFENIIML